MGGRRESKSRECVVWWWLGCGVRVSVCVSNVKKEEEMKNEEVMFLGKKNVVGSEAKSRCVIVDRDVKCCQWVCEQGAMTVEQLYRAVWWSAESRSSSYAYERIQFLEREGFLEGVKTPYSLKTFFRPTKKTQALVSSRIGEVRPVPVSLVPSNEIPHTDVLTELRLAVIRAGRLGSWRTDRMLNIDPEFPKHRFEVAVPDVIWTTKDSKRRIAIEYERSRKGKRRTQVKVEALSRELARADRAFDLVLWIGAPGAYQDLSLLLKNHPNQQLRRLDEFLAEIGQPKTESN